MPKPRHRDHVAWLSYLGIQVAWMLLVFLTPLAAVGHPSKLWALPFTCITMAGGLHLTYFRRQYGALVERLVEIIPAARHLLSARQDPRYYLPLGVVYTFFGVASAFLVLFS